MAVAEKDADAAREKLTGTKIKALPSGRVRHAVASMTAVKFGCFDKNCLASRICDVADMINTGIRDIMLLQQLRLGEYLKYQDIRFPIQQCHVFCIFSIGFTNNSRACSHMHFYYVFCVLL